MSQLIDSFLKNLEKIPEKNINTDYLIPRPQLFFYCDEKDLEQIRQNGILLNSSTVVMYPARIPDDVLSSSSLVNKVPLKVSLSKLENSNDNFFVSLVYNNNQERINFEDVEKFSSKPEFFQNYLRKVGIDKCFYFTVGNSSGNTIPAFCIKAVEQ